VYEPDADVALPSRDQSRPDGSICDPDEACPTLTFPFASLRLTCKPLSVSDLSRKTIGRS